MSEKQGTSTGRKERKAFTYGEDPVFERKKSKEKVSWLDDVAILLEISPLEDADDEHEATRWAFDRVSMLMAALSVQKDVKDENARKRIIDIISQVSTIGGPKAKDGGLMEFLDERSRDPESSPDFSKQDGILYSLLQCIGTPSPEEREALSWLWKKDFMKVRVDQGYTYYTKKAEKDWRPQGEAAFDFRGICIGELEDQGYWGEVHESLNNSRERLLLSFFPDKVIETAEDLDLLMEWVKTTDEVYEHREKVGELLRSNPSLIGRAVKELQEILQTHPISLRRELAWSLLRRIDLGDVPVENGNVEYLNNEYSIHGAKNPSVVRRLTTDGKVAVFDEEKCLEGYFSIKMPQKDVIGVDIQKVQADDLFPSLEGGRYRLARKAHD